MKRKMRILNQEQIIKKNKENVNYSSIINLDINNSNLNKENSSININLVTKFHHSKNSGFRDTSLIKYGCSKFNENGYYVLYS